MVLQDAFEAAQRFLDERIRPEHNVEIVIGSCKEHDDVWCFGFNTRAMIEDGAIGLIGSGPVVVPKSGAQLYIATVFDTF